MARGSDSFPDREITFFEKNIIFYCAIQEKLRLCVQRGYFDLCFFGDPVTFTQDNIMFLLKLFPLLLFIPFCLMLYITNTFTQSVAIITGHLILVVIAAIPVFVFAIDKIQNLSLLVWHFGFTYALIPLFVFFVFALLWPLMPFIGESAFSKIWASSVGIFSFLLYTVLAFMYCRPAGACKEKVDIDLYPSILFGIFVTLAFIAVSVSVFLGANHPLLAKKMPNTPIVSDFLIFFGTGNAEDYHERAYHGILAFLAVIYFFVYVIYGGCVYVSIKEKKEPGFFGTKKITEDEAM